MLLPEKRSKTRCNESLAIIRILPESAGPDEKWHGEHAAYGPCEIHAFVTWFCPLGQGARRPVKGITKIPQETFRAEAWEVRRS